MQAGVYLGSIKGASTPTSPFPPFLSLFLLPLPIFSLPSHPLYSPPSTPFPSPSLRSTLPLIQLRSLGERCKLPQRVPGNLKYIFTKIHQTKIDKVISKNAKKISHTKVDQAQGHPKYATAWVQVFLSYCSPTYSHLLYVTII